MEKNDSIGARLREEREKTGKNQTEFASLAGQTRQTQSNYEKGERVPDANYLSTIASIVDVGYILTGHRTLSEPAKAGSGDQPHQIKEGVANYGSLPVNADMLAGIIEGVEKSLESHKLKLTPEKKAQMVSALYDYAIATGQAGDAQVERLVKLAS